MQGDASTRIYERLTLGDQQLILMNCAAAARWPAGARRPALQRDRPSRRQTSRRSWRWPRALRAHGLSAPEIHHADLEQGLLILEDLGDERVVAGDPPAPIKERYETAVDALLHLHGQPLPRRAAGRAAASNTKFRPTTWMRS